ncbi:hypothetical protein [Streptomyces sp. ID05-47C]|uniref:hypothetical protein n=1 Tax=Streptomyces sp. ID05-47C TaxID=3028665 RepID=UPI0029B62ED6|nr:hypothetical protein [Streptomyces sp. ID05-47C]MDX3570808.1 hypothetical protein [Streptomyces sp. ID05-47C]
MAYDEDPTIPPLTVRGAANRLGLSVWAVHKAIERGELRPVVRNPIKVSAGDVEQMRLRKRDEAVERIGLDRMARVAGDVRRQMHPSVEAPGPRGHAAIEKLSETVKAAFTMPLLHAAAMPDGSGCRWCGAEIAGRMLGVPVRSEMLSSEFGLALLGGPGCERHRGLVTGRMAALAARVHPGGARPSAARTEAPQPPATPAPRQPAQRTVTTAAKPVQDDDGKAMVARRRREVQARLTAAKRAGDQKYAIHLRQTLTELTADAARVDGWPVSAKPGRLACGHLVSAGCVCARRASKRGQR